MAESEVSYTQGVKQKKQTKFGGSLERYVFRRLKSAPFRWEWVGVAGGFLVIVVSLLTGYFSSPTLYSNKIEIIREAAEAGDYQTARMLYEQEDSKVLGASLELEELVYPEIGLAREIREQEELLARFPGSRDILLTLSKLYEQAENREKSSEYFEAARLLDPNGEEVEEIILF